MKDQSLVPFKLSRLGELANNNRGQLLLETHYALT